MLYIDDIFFICQLSVESLQSFLKDLNSFSNLKFTSIFSKEIITFLDVDIFLESGILKRKPHLKPINTKKYLLHYDSCHPIYVKKSVPNSLAVREKSFCTNESYFQEYIKKLNNAFRNISYNPNKIIKIQLHSPKF